MCEPVNPKQQRGGVQRGGDSSDRRRCRRHPTAPPPPPAPSAAAATASWRARPPAGAQLSRRGAPTPAPATVTHRQTPTSPAPNCPRPPAKTDAEVQYVLCCMYCTYRHARDGAIQAVPPRPRPTVCTAGWGCHRRQRRQPRLGGHPHGGAPRRRRGCARARHARAAGMFVHGYPRGRSVSPGGCGGDAPPLDGRREPPLGGGAAP